ncbi:DUF2252 domain-containing protein [Streptomyces sp. NPDC002187]|uniref:DUF2252 domain-containing protein n=1 Tax=Streptomyces sp. NPDC002187 TaxID=3364637 RepID=UPI0036C2848C
MTATSSARSHFTVAERAAQGRAARSVLRRSQHARFVPSGERPDPVGILEAQSATRVADLVPIRYGRMLESPFRFYRGAAAIMAADLGPSPHTSMTTQLCGDAHLLNFRMLASPERRLVFDINDFDETHPGPFEWDVKRLSASLVIAGRANGFDEGQRTAAVKEAVEHYRERMHQFAGMHTLDVWYAADDAEQLEALLPDEEMRRRASRAMAKARTRDNIKAFDKLTHVVDGVCRFAPDPPLITPLRDLLPGVENDDVEAWLRSLLGGYRHTLSSERRHLLDHFRIVDVARKVVGVGSVGTRCWIILLVGRDDDDPLILQAKEAGESVLAPYTGRGGFDHQGERVVAGQRLMQTAGDIFLGWERAVGVDGRRRDFYVRQLHDWKGIVQPDTMTAGMLRVFGGVCGDSLARAHARSGDPIAIAAYLGTSDSFDRALAQFAEAYADQNERDYDAFRQAVESGRLTAATATA